MAWLSAKVPEVGQQHTLFTRLATRRELPRDRIAQRGGIHDTAPDEVDHAMNLS